ncbi:MAG TPA: hypothetical protein VLA92_04810 [Candidatus Saccharimonadales bacterium]|nr:hypothetical protein [Candidatus Saccharimonadales bacterium]
MWSKNSKRLGLIAGALLVVTPVKALANQVQSTICPPLAAPSITAPATTSETNQSSVHVVGIAPAGKVVTVYRNGLGSGATTATSNGTYAIETPIDSGNNQLMASTSNECNTMRQSSAVTVKRTTYATPDPDTTPTTAPPPAQTAPTPAPSITTTRPVVIDLTPVTTASSALPTPLPAAPQISSEPDNAITEIQKEVITDPKPGETIKSERMWVKGKAKPLSVVAIYINLVIAAQVVADEAGSYGALVDLQPGSNSVHVKAIAQDGSRTTRVINIQLVKKPTQQAKPTPQNNTGAYIIIGSIAGGSLLIMGGIYYEIYHIRHKARGVRNV